MVFDCGNEVEGQSLNKKLLQGPDMTNQLVGVLCRFRLDKVAFMGDIEAMFYQVRLPEAQRGFFQFLWWDDGDISKELKNFEMNVYLLGGSSSPGCCNFALRQAAIDGEKEFGKASRSALEENFYVDDLLKSVPDEATAIELIKNVSGMCKKGGFYLYN